MFKDFDRLNEDQWKERIISELKGKDYSTVEWQTEGLELQPFYREDPSQKFPEYNQLLTYLRQGIRKGWLIRENYDVNSTNKELIEALKNGCSSVSMKGISNFKEFLEGVFPEMIQLSVEQENWSDLIKYLGQEKADKINLCVGFSPLEKVIQEENYEYNILDDFSKMHAQMQGLKSSKILKIDASYFESCGANIIQQLTYSIALANDYFEQLSDSFSIDEISAMTYIEVNVGHSYFLEIAKCRALRILYAELIKAYSPQHNCSIHSYLIGKTSPLIYGVIDKESNLVRNTIAGMAASIGTCDEIEISNHSNADSNARRLARNIHNLIKEESYLDQVKDISKGSFYIDSLTFQFVKNAWKEFMKIEANGGFKKALKNNLIQAAIKSSAQKKINGLNSGAEVMIGENKYLKKKDAEQMKWQLSTGSIGFPKIEWNG